MGHAQSIDIQNKRRLLVKVPQITVWFWITKILTTGMGEIFSDYLCRRINPVIAVALGAFGLTISLVLQFAAKNYNRWVYWLTVVMVSIFGTIAADVLHVGLGIPYLVSTVIYIILLSVAFVLWFHYERTLSIHSINTGRREVFYWATVLFTFALGTAAGDMTASSLHMGYFQSGILFAALFALPILAGKVFGLNEVFVFWFAYIMTRPFGASFADWISLPLTRGGLGAGTLTASIVLTILIIVFIGFFKLSRKDITP